MWFTVEARVTICRVVVVFVVNIAVFNLLRLVVVVVEDLIMKAGPLEDGRPRVGQRQIAHQVVLNRCLHKDAHLFET